MQHRLIKMHFKPFNFLCDFCRGGREGHSALAGALGSKRTTLCAASPKASVVEGGRVLRLKQPRSVLVTVPITRGWRGLLSYKHRWAGGIGVPSLSQEGSPHWHLFASICWPVRLGTTINLKVPQRC